MDALRKLKIVGLFSVMFTHDSYSMDFLSGIKSLGNYLLGSGNINNLGNEIANKVTNFITGNDTTSESPEQKSMYDEFCSCPVGFLNDQVYTKFTCTCDNQYYANNKGIKCKTDNDTGLHYKQFGNLKSNKYIFFFHGMLYDIDDSTMKEIIDKIQDDSFEYNVVAIEWNSFTDPTDKAEKTLGFTDISEMSDKIYKFMINFLRPKSVDQLILCGHSHGNNYPIELLKRFHGNDSYKQKLIYLGCKGYLDIRAALCNALEVLAQDKNFGGFVRKILSAATSISIPGLKKFVNTVMIFALRFFIGAENFDPLIENNDNEKKMLDMLDYISIKNICLGEESHLMTLKDLEIMIEKLKDINIGGDKIPCLLFYSNTDEYVGPSFAKVLIKKSEDSITEEEKKKEEKEKEEVEKAEEAIKKVYKVLDEKVETVLKPELTKKGIDVSKFQASIKGVREAKDGLIKREHNDKKTPNTESAENKGCCKNSCKGNRKK